VEGSIRQAGVCNSSKQRLVYSVFQSEIVIAAKQGTYLPAHVSGAPDQ